jgi:hypothetical protein
MNGPPNQEDDELKIDDKQLERMEEAYQKLLDEKTNLEK